MPLPALTTVLIADDDSQQLALTTALVAKLRPDWKIISDSGDVAHIEQTMRRVNPTVAILEANYSAVPSLTLSRNRANSCAVIYVTRDPLFAAQAFTCKATDFVLKPIQMDRIEQALRRVELHWQGNDLISKTPAFRKSHSLRILKGNELIWASLNEVRYFEAERKNTRVVLKDQEGLLQMGMTSVVQHLNPEGFWRIHRGIVVNMAHMVNAKRDEFGRLAVFLKDRRQSLIVAKPYEHVFQDGFC